MTTCRPPGRPWGRRIAGLLSVLGIVGTAAVVSPPAGPLTLGSTPAWAAPGLAQYPEYWFDRWGVPRLWAQGHRGGGVTVAILDTGVQADLPEFRGSVLAGTDLTGLGGDGRVNRDERSFAHGTAMASLIVAHGGSGSVVGVAPAAKILPITIPLVGTDQKGADGDYVARAIRYAADHGANIISMSFGGDRILGHDPLSCPPTTQNAIYYAVRKGAVLVAASGNEGEAGNRVEEPGVCLGVVSVGAVDANDRRAGFSSAHRYLTVAAPGVNVVSLNASGDVYVGDGTSQAAALTSGALALIWSAHPAESGRTVTARLMAGLHDAGAVGPDSGYGYGIVDPSASLASEPGPASPNPVFSRVDPFVKKQFAAPEPDLTAGPPARVGAVPGSYRRDRPPGRLTARIIKGIGLIGLGVGAGLLAIVGAVRRRAARRSARQPPPPTAVSEVAWPPGSVR